MMFYEDKHGLNPASYIVGNAFRLLLSNDKDMVKGRINLRPLLFL